MLPVNRSSGYGPPLFKIGSVEVRHTEGAGANPSLERPVVVPSEDELLAGQNHSDPHQAVALLKGDWPRSGSLHYAVIGPRRLKWFSKRAQPRHRLQYLSKTDGWKELPADIRRKLSMLNGVQLQRVTDTYLAIEDCLVLSTPELYSGGPKSNAILNRVWSWVICNAVHHNGVRNVTAMWKSLTSHIKARAIKSLEPIPRIIRGTIFANEIGEIVSLKGTALSWLDRVLNEGLQTKSEGTRLMHFISTRGLPAPQMGDLISHLNEHGEIVTGPRSDWVYDPDRAQLLYKIGLRLGHYARKQSNGERPSAAHLSLSNSAALESSRRSGGRCVSVGKSFAQWYNTVSTESRDEFTLFGKRFWRVEGVKYGHTMCLPNLGAGNLIESDNQFDIDVDFVNFKYQDRIFGLNSKTGYQMLQWALEEGFTRGTFVGNPWYSPGEMPGIGVPPSVKASPIGEPGGKSRTITVGEDWVSQFLSPFGHEMISWLELLPAARSGLSAAAMGYEYVKRIGTREIDDLPELFWLTSDLTSASEYLEHSYTKPLLEGFVEGAGLSSPYMTLAIQLLASPRFLEPSDLSGYDHTGKTTCRASLMGDPGTKAALTLTMMASEEEAFLTYVGKQMGKSILEMLDLPEPHEVWRCFASAGDDHLACGPLEYLRLIKSVISLNGGVVSQDKAFISPIGAYFTEELILRTRASRIHLKGRMLWNVPYQETIHVDALKVRLLSPVAKITLVADEKNPALGKSRDFAKKLSWLPKPWQCTKELFLRRFFFRFKGFLDLKSIMTYLPRYLGGLGLPVPDFISDEDLATMVVELPTIVKKTVLQLQAGTCTPMERNALRAYASNTTFRGFNARTLAEEQLKAVFGLFVPDSVRFEDLRQWTGIEDPVRWEMMRKADKVRAASRAGLISLKEAIQLFERPTYFKEVLAGLTGLLQTDETILAFKMQESAVRATLSYLDCTFDELERLNPELFRAYRSAQSKSFARQMFIETWAFELIPGSGLVPRFEKPEDSKIESFKSLPWPARMANLVSDLRFVCGSSTGKETDDSELFAFVRGNRTALSSMYRDDGDEIFIRRSRIEDLCTLSTGLLPRQKWPDQP